MARLGFREKMLLAQFFGIVVAGVYYGYYLAATGPGHHWFHAVVLGVLLFLGSMNLLLRHGAGGVVEDERDRAIAAIGLRWSNTILWVGLVLILVIYWDHGTMRSAGFVIGVLFHLLLLAGLVRIIRELVAYRMAA